MQKPKRKPPKPPPEACPDPDPPKRGRPKLYDLPDPDAPALAPEPPADPVACAIGFLLSGHQYHDAAEAIRELYPGQSDVQILTAATDHFRALTDEPPESVLGFVAAAARDTFRKCSNISDTGNAIAALKLLLTVEKQIRDLRATAHKSPKKVGPGDPFAVFDLAPKD